MKQKDMRRSEWRRILERKYHCAPFSHQDKQGIASVLTIQKVSEPLVIHYEHGDVTIACEGDIWLQLALQDSYLWVTAMFDAEHRLQQIYFDITNGNCFEDPTNPTFEDLYLDLVLEADGTIHVLDRDELDEALRIGEITTVTYQRAVDEGEKLYRYLQNHWQAFVAFCFEKMMELKGMQANGTH